MTAALEHARLRRSFGGFIAVDGVSLEIEAGARHALIGPNGAGKTTLINLLTGMLRPTRGDVLARRRARHRHRAARARQARPGADVPDQHAVRRG